MQCLLAHRSDQDMTDVCRHWIDHYELVSMRSYKFTPKFAHACKKDIEKHCSEIHKGEMDKATIVRCLSTARVRGLLLDENDPLDPKCSKHLSKAFLDVERVSGSMFLTPIW